MTINRMRRWTANTLIAALVLSGFGGASVPAVSASAEPVKVWMTTGDKSKLLDEQEDVFFEADSGQEELTINVDENTKYQSIDGFGGSLTDSSAYVIYNELDETAREELMNKLFGLSDGGVGFSYMRLPMGSSDFATSTYTYNDRPAGGTDLALEHFSIEHDSAYIIPVIKQALEINPELKIVASPWSAPAWMKTNDSLIKGKLKPEYYDVYARYFVKFIQAYEAEGIAIDAVTLQNEPHHEAGDYPGMRMEPEEQAAFVKRLGPAFEEAGIDTKILVWDHNWDEPVYPIDVLNDPEAKPYIAGSAFHGYAGSVENQSQVHDLHPDKDIYFTESSGGDFAPDFGSNVVWDTQNLLIGAMRHWAKTSLKWNIALDENHGPRVGGCTDCRGIVTIDTGTDEITYNEEFYAFGHASKFIRPGAYRIKSNTFGSGSIENAAFLNPDGSKALLALNSSNGAKPFKVRWGSESFTYTLPAGAVATFVWSGTQSGDSAISPYAKTEAEDASDYTGVTTGVANDTGGGGFVGSTTDGSYIAYRNAEFASGTASVRVRAAAEGDGAIEFRLGSPTGTYVGGVYLVDTGGPQSWRTKAAQVEAVVGAQPLYVVFKGHVNLNWFQFSSDFVQDSYNYLTIGGGFEEGDLAGWSGWTPEGQASAHKEEGAQPRSGNFKLNHYASDAYEQTTYRTVKVPNGTYKASVWFQKGGSTNISLLARNYGGAAINAPAATTDYVGEWTQLVIPAIHVTNGQVEIGVHSDNAAGEWVNFDDVELMPVTSRAPASADGAAAPDTPQDVNVSVINGYNVKLDWSPAEDADGYGIYRSGVQSDTVADSVYADYRLIGLAPQDAVSYVDQGLRGDTTYSYRISAYNGGGESAATDAYEATTDSGSETTAPVAPEGLSAAPGVEQVQLTWQPSLESDFLQYNIYVNGVKSASVEPAPESRYTVAKLTAGRAYSFAVTAVDHLGNESPAGDTVTATPAAAGVLVPFPNMDFESGSLSPWQEWHPEGQSAAAFVDSDSPRGQYKLTHWGGSDYKQSTYRTLDVPNGTYKVQAWVRTGGGQNTFQLEVKNYGGDQRTKDLRSASGGTWTLFAIDGIQVTAGKMEIGVYSDAPGGNWAAIDDFEVYSYAAPSIAVTGITLDKSALSLNLGVNKTGLLTATVAPADAANKEVSWSSSDEAVATVEGGVVTARSVGEAVIEATTADGGFRASAIVTVKRGTTPPPVFNGGGDGQAPGLIIERQGDSNVIKGMEPKREVHADGSRLDIFRVDAGIVASAAQGDGVSRVTLDARGANRADRTEAIFPVSALREIAKNNRKLVLTVLASQGSYELPLAAIIEELESGDRIRIDIHAAKGAAAEEASASITNNGGTLVGSPVQFQAWIGKDAAWRELTSFGKHFVTRSIALGNQHPSTAAGVMVDEDGELHPIPISISLAPDGTATAILKSNHNSIYAVASFDKQFTDVEGHSDERAIEALASKLILHGTGNGRFVPEGGVTRAEWAAMLTRSLGLSASAQASEAFGDVSAEEWYAEAVAAAVEVGIVHGFEDGTFRPNEQVTRQQMAVTLANAAAKLLGGFDSAAAEGAGSLDGLEDRGDIAAWALASVEQVLNAGLIKGSPDGLFRPTETGTRAEAAAILFKLIDLI
ncbi:S-layer homology domain-containing protein [Paenibacillus harenae]|uniref:S-layer homology domain-containing protein n=1 Tax=Paenibacillus harenae TaxID=306543 RepID=UPI00279161CA|nr:S-layer homology domain-containing protein [Paenibacillus harenae]MDQ0062197.1 glucosylceramidase [Paenibacillus harenae]